MNLPKISVCVCTYQRPRLLERLLSQLLLQETDGQFTYEVVVADNDKDCSAQSIVSRIAEKSPVRFIYCAEPEQSIALARNRALVNAGGDYVAFIDDDEVPRAEWLKLLLATCLRYQVDGALGPVRPYFEQTPPDWVVKGRFYFRPEHETGHVLPWENCRTGNVLFRRAIVNANECAFRPEFRSGGEDRDFFRRKIAEGCRFVWCNEAEAKELVPPIRWNRRFLLRRALLRGKASMARREGMAKRLFASMVAIPAYVLLLPVMAAVGQHLFMRYLIRLTDHLGRVLEFLHINPVRENYVIE